MRVSRIEEAKEVEWYIVLAFDEMKIKEGLLYNKHLGHIVGYILPGGNQQWPRGAWEESERNSRETNCGNTYADFHGTR